jgi:hypothetical protein
MKGLLLAALLAATSAGAAERFAVVVGANRGAPARAKLWYAEKDAQRFAAALEELGDFPTQNVTLLPNPKADGLRAAWADMEARVQQARAAGQRTLLVFYFSGHAGAGALELGDERLEFTELKRVMEASGADVKVAIVDACESGGLTQVKGARPSQVDFVLPTDDTARGVAYLASTAAGEVAQESAAIGASFFTFHLEAALRGAGDANGDGLVSLTEAFQYTASRTITGTSSTDVGPQHPTYNFRMAGRGDVVLSDLRHARARLQLPVSERSTWVVSQQGRLVVEAPGGLTLALPAGEYSVEKREGGKVSGAEVTLKEGETGVVGALTERRVLARGKGGEAPLYVLQVGGGVDAPLLAGFSVMPGVRLALRRSLGGAFGARLALGYSDGVGLLSGTTSSRVQTGLVELAGLFRLLDADIFIDVGVELVGAVHAQSVPGRALVAFSFGGGATGTVGARLGTITLSLQGSLGARAVPVEGALAARLAGQALASVGVEF